MMDRDGYRKALLAVGIAGFVLRAALVIVFPPDLEALGTGDADFYVRAARTFAELGVFQAPPLPPFPKPPGLPLALVVLLKLTGENAIAVGLVMAAAGSSGIWLMAAIARRVWPERRSLHLAAATVFAFDPVQVYFCRAVLTEGLVTILVLALLLMLLRGPGLGHIALAGATIGALTLIRTDLLALLLLVPFVILRSPRIGPVRLSGTAGSLALSAAVCLLTVAPWSLYASHQTGEFVLTAPPPRGSGFSRWLTTLDLTPSQWRHAAWNFPRGEVDPSFVDTINLPSDEKRAARELLGRAMNGSREELSRARIGFLEMARQRTADAPIRTFLWLPAKRSLQLWARYHETVGPGDRRLFIPWSPGVVVFSIWKLPFIPLALLGFLAAFYLVADKRVAVATLAALVLLRTFSLLWAGAAAGYSLMETRYLAMAQPAAMLLALEALRRAVMARRRLS